MDKLVQKYGDRTVASIMLRERKMAEFAIQNGINDKDLGIIPQISPRLSVVSISPLGKPRTITFDKESSKQNELNNSLMRAHELLTKLNQIGNPSYTLPEKYKNLRTL